MSQAIFISELIATSHLAQIIHQRGLLIFANISAARLFGFDSVAGFVEFAHRTNLFGPATDNLSKANTRMLTFRQHGGLEIKASVTEQAINWNGHPSAHVTLKPVYVDEHDANEDEGRLVSQRLIQISEEEAYFRDSFQAALDTNREDSGTFTKINKPFDLAGALVRLCDDMTPYAQANGVSLSLEISPKALNIFQGDSAKMSRAAKCMLHHAISRVPGGIVKVKVLVDEAGNSIRLEVGDNGPAYTAWESISLVTPPAPSEDDADNDINPPELNLPMAQCIANFLGGTLNLKVNHPTGGLIRLKLPMLVAHGESRNSVRPKSDHLPISILVAEDNFTSQQVIKIILQALGYVPTIVSNGAQCLEALSHGNYDLILMDLHMPVMDGYKATRLIRATELAKGTHTQLIPILALTADARAKTRMKAEQAGVTGFLTKPIHIPQILSALTPILDAIRGGASDANTGERKIA
jgi:CheY-like chemotaxis protein